MDYYIALSPDLGLSPEQLVAAWNDSPECRAVAQARLEHAAGGQFTDPLAATVMAVLGGLVLNMASNALYDLIKHALIKQDVRKHTRIIEEQQPDGKRILIVEIDE